MPETDAQPTDVTDELPVIPGYELLRVIGAGGMSRVILARSSQGELVAIKLIVEGDTQRLAQEVAIWEEVSHPRIVRLLDHGRCDAGIYLVLDYIDGGTLRERMGQPLSPQAACDILQQIGEGLTYLHSRGIGHRDLKPENVLVQSDGEVRLTDFSLATKWDCNCRLTQEGEILGTPDYMAPEQRHELPMDHRTDQYSLAVVAYEMLTGVRPLGSFKCPSEHNRSLTGEVDEAIMTALSMDPDDRFDSTATFLEHLTSALQQSSIPRRAQLIQWMFAGSLTTVIVLLLVNVFQRWQVGQEPQPGTELPLMSLRAVNQSYEQERQKELESLKEAAHAMWRAGKPNQAIELISRQTEEFPDRFDLRNLRAHFLWKQQHFDQALDDLKASLKLNPEQPEVLTKIGSILIQKGEREEALTWLNRVIDEYSDEAGEAYAFRARLRYFAKQFDEELQDLDRAIELSPELGIAYHFRGMVHRRRRNYDQAISDFEASLRLTPDNPFAYAQLAKTLATCRLRKLRDGNRALALAKKANELSGGYNYICLQTLSTAYAQCDEIDEAIRIAKKASKVAPPNKRASIARQIQLYENRKAGRPSFKEDAVSTPKKSTAPREEPCR